MEQANENLLRPISDCCERRRVRSNSEVVCELAIERNTTCQMLEKLKKSIEANPEAVSAHHKELWRKQAKAMQEYVDVLGERIKDLIDNG
jgi:hypothetical protein